LRVDVQSGSIQTLLKKDSQEELLTLPNVTKRIENAPSTNPKKHNLLTKAQKVIRERKILDIMQRAVWETAGESRIKGIGIVKSLTN
jgi:hypothetical protein